MRVALVQMTSTDNVAENLLAARRAIDEAAERGAEFIALPENFAFLRREGNPIPAPQGLDGEIIESVRELARRHRLPILAGTFAERMEGDSRVYNTSALIDETGRIAAVYRKIHLFDVDLRESGGGVYRESAVTAPGSEIVVAETRFGRLGLSVCYDVRFPEHYRALRELDVIFVPSAFTVPTGEAHWEPLLRARAIENQAYVVAPAQGGTHASGRRTYGHTMAIDPWGAVLGVHPEGEGIVLADIDLEHSRQLRRRFA